MLQVNKYDLVKGFSGIIDMVNSLLLTHHQRVAYVVDCLCEAEGISESLRRTAVIASLIHDVGVIPLRYKTDNMVLAL